MESELPDGWECIKMGELCEVINGSTPKTSHSEFWDGDILWITPKDLTGFKDIIINDTSRKITKNGYDSCSTHLVPKGTVLMSSRAPIGYLAIAGKELCTNQGFKSFVCSERINNRYLYYHLKGIVPKLKQEGQGTTFDEISKTKAENIEVPIPFPNDKEKSLKIQKQIVAKLDAFFKEYDILKEEKEKAQDNYDKILQSAITKLVFQEAEINGWPIRPLSEVAEIIMGQSPPSSTYNQIGKGLPFYQGKKEFGKKYPTVMQWCSESSKIAEKGDVLLSVRAPVGPVNIATEKCCIGRGLGAIRAKELLEPEYLYYFMKGNEITLSFSGRGSTFDSINRKDVDQIKIPVPPNKKIQLELIKKIELLASVEEIVIQENIALMKNIFSLPHSVLTKAFAGELVN